MELGVNCTDFCMLLLEHSVNGTIEYLSSSMSDGTLVNGPDDINNINDQCSAVNCSSWLKDTQGLEFDLSKGRGSGSSRSRAKANVPQAPLYILICVSILYIVIFVVGMTGNFLVVLVVCRTKEMRNTTNFFLVNLSVADLLVILVCMPSAFVDIFSKEVWYLGPVMCRLVPLLENMVALASVLTILAISFERYYAICRPLEAGYTCTFGRMLKIVIAIWIISFLLCLPFVAMTVYKDSRFIDGTPIKVCRTYTSRMWQKIYMMAMTGVFFVIPLIILLLIYTVISRQLMSDRMTVGSASDKGGQSQIHARRQVVLMLFMVVVFFFVCLLPMQTVRLYLLWATKKQIYALGLEGYLNLLYFARVMLYVNSAINPICYNVVSTKFRDAFRRVFGCGSPRRHALNRRNTFTTTVSYAGGSEHGSVKRTRSNGSSMPLTTISSAPATEVTGPEGDSTDTNNCDPSQRLVKTSLIDNGYSDENAQCV